MQPWKTGCVREKWERKRTCSRCEIKTNQDWEMWSSLGGERRAWDHPSLSIGVEKLQVEKVSEMGTGRHFEAMHANRL